MLIVCKRVFKLSCFKSQAFDAEVKMLFGTPDSRIGVASLKYRLLSQFQLPAHAHLGEAGNGSNVWALDTHMEHMG